jgi:hypothetical protein
MAYAPNPIKIQTTGLYNNTTNECMVTHSAIYDALAKIAGMIPLEGSINLFIQKDQDSTLPWQLVFKLTNRGFVEIKSHNVKDGLLTASFHPKSDVIFNLLINSLRNPRTEIVHTTLTAIGIIIDSAMYQIGIEDGSVRLMYADAGIKDVKLSTSQKEDIRILAAARYNQLYG